MTDLKKISLVVLVLGLTALAAWPFIGGSEPYQERTPSPRPIALLAQSDSPSLTPLTAPGEATIAPVNRGSAVSPATLPGSTASPVSPLPSLSMPATKPPPLLPQNYQPLLKTQPAKPAELEPVNPIETPGSFAPPAEETNSTQPDNVTPPSHSKPDTGQPAEPSVPTAVSHITVKRLPPVEDDAPAIDPRTFPVYASTTPITAGPVAPSPDAIATVPPEASIDKTPAKETSADKAPAINGGTLPATELIPVAPAMRIGETTPRTPPEVSTPVNPAETPAPFDPTEPRRLLPAATVADATSANPLRELGEIQPLRQAFKPPVKNTPTPGVSTRVVRHRIVDGDTLESLAQRYLGNPARAGEIYGMNRGVLSHPQLLPINGVLLIHAEQ